MTGNVVKRIPSALVSVIVALVSAYFFTAQREEVIQWSKKVAPKAIEARMTMVIYNLKYAVGGYFKAQFKIMVIVGLILLCGFLILGVDYAFLLALLIAFLDFLPFFGTGTALIPWAVYKFLCDGYQTAVGLLVIYGITQLVRQVIQPKHGWVTHRTEPSCHAGFIVCGLPDWKYFRNDSGGAGWNDCIQFVQSRSF